jgi:hypothetical protein
MIGRFVETTDVRKQHNVPHLGALGANFTTVANASGFERGAVDFPLGIRMVAVHLEKMTWSI